MKLKVLRANTIAILLLGQEVQAAVVLGSLGLLDCLKRGAATGPKRAAWVPWGL